MAKETAEQKLLKLIETTEAKETGGASPAAPNVAQQVADAVKGPGFGKSFPPFLASFLNRLKGSSSQPTSAFGLKELNIIIMVFTVSVFVFFVLDIVRGLRLAQEADISSGEFKPVGPPGQTNLFVKEFSEYLEIVSQRNIFQPFEKKKEEEFVNLPPETRRIAEQTKDLKLVGISWLDTPESASALIENTKSGITYFLRSGDKVNGVTIKTIYADSIIFNLEGEDLKLSL